MSPKVKERVPGICVLHDTIVLVLLFAPLLIYIYSLNLYSIDILGGFW